MASNTMATWHKRTHRHNNMGRKRKNADARHSTQSYTELFAGLGEPGKPAGAAVAAKASAKVAKKPAGTAAASK
jgi:hypothetical protein